MTMKADQGWAPSHPTGDGLRGSAHQNTRTPWFTLTAQLFLWLVLVCTVAAAGAQRADAGTGPGLAGTTPCAAVLNALRTSQSPAPELLAFLSGYSSARYAGTTRRARAEVDPFFGLPAADVQRWLADWCQAHPQRPLADAAQQFFDQLPGAGTALAARSATSALGVQADTTSTCSAPAVGVCAGCSVSCNSGRQAHCSPGRDGGRTTPSAFNRCGAPSQCDCR